MILRLLGLLVTLTSLAHALSAPELTVRGARGGKAQLVIAEVKADVFLFADIAETELTITFRNTKNRVLEGEFAMPLPTGATVTGYALDVNGSMREGVVIEKKRARNAYEAIKRKMIDPGYVEREAGNVYRTKIFPIPRKGTKSVQLSYREFLSSSEGKFTYQLPFASPVSIENLTIHIEDSADRQLTPLETNDVQFKNTKPGVLTAKHKKHVVSRPITVKYVSSKKAQLFTAGEHFYLSKPGELAPKSKAQTLPESIVLAWDCSESGRLRDHKAEFAFLDDYFARFEELKVELMLLHLHAESAGIFVIKKGEWKKLRSRLETIFYDGATDLRLLKCDGRPTLLVTDGLSHFGLSHHTWTSPVHLLDTRGQAQPYWQEQCYQSGGQYLQHKYSGKTSTLPLRAINNIPIAQFGRLGTSSERIFGTFPNHDGRLFELRYGNDAGTSRVIKLSAQKLRKSRLRKLIQGAHAQARLQKLEFTTPRDRDAITQHCKIHGLVSDETSFIVLERFEDYVRYRIPPPEPELRKHYEKEIKKTQSSSQQKSLSDSWQRMQNWLARDFPWQERFLFPMREQIDIWDEAINEVFPEEVIQATSIKKLKAWNEQARKIIAQRSSLKTHKEYLVWREQLRALEKQVAKFPKQEPAPGEIIVSVRGLVKEEGNQKAKALTLTKAVEMAGGPHILGSPTAVALYRNATKTLYNTLSKDFKDISLCSGDMVVVETEPEIDDYGWGDPFADGTEETTKPDPSMNPAIVNQPLDRNGAFKIITLGTSDGNDIPSVRKTSVFSPLVTIIPNALEIFAKKLAAGNDPLATYREARPGARYDDSFYREISALLLKHGHKKLARRALSNLIEDKVARPASHRRLAYLLAKQGEWDVAWKIIVDISSLFPKDQLLATDRAWLATHLTPAQEAGPHLKQAVNSLDHIELAALALRELRAADSHADLRVVVTSASGQTPWLSVHETEDTILHHREPASISGGWLTHSSGISEYIIRKAIPGNYRFKIRSHDADILRVQVYRNWGRDSQTLSETIVEIQGDRTPHELAKFKITLPN